MHGWAEARQCLSFEIAALKRLIEARINDGIANGVSTFVVETEAPSIGRPNISYENLRKIGFRHAYDRKNFKL